MNTVETSTLGCVKAASEILGDKWTPQLLRYFLNEQTVRFCQLQDLVGNINPRTLSARLVMLESEGIIVKQFTHSQKRCDYALTQKGKALLPIIQDMQDWSANYG